ncbi:uncharacterized protein LOC113157251 isoform X2 [Anabas testudineus]|uniref:uncharacterized protein LOC113157251 isoform X2 n=1 Tax=Anabas testudineus TaxID=64144 RepID=UPI000E4653F8|nr:uncharacterized protein LOC113157251 isoform X2 [Anabas testudineus]
MNFILIRALILCSFSWISVLVSYNVKAQSGDSITLLCPKTSETVTTWFRLVNRTKASCIALMIKSDKDPEYCDGFQNGHFKMETNISTVFLKIKHVDLSDSGLYFCHFFFGGRGVYYVIYLSVEGSDEFQDDEDRKSEKCETTNLMSLILGALTVFLVLVVIGLAVTVRNLHSAANDKHSPQQQENLGSDDLNYAAVTFHQKERRRQIEPNVVYSATR